MTIWDDRILEEIRNEGAGRVGKLGDTETIRISNPHISRRCKALAEHGLLTALGNGVYTITKKGEAYLDGEFDAENEVFLNGDNTQDGPSASGKTET